MMGRTHIASGVVAWMAAAPILGTGPVETMVGGVLAGWAALGPDIDHPGATLPRKLGASRRLATLVARVTGGHRGGTHSVLAAVLAGYLVAWSGPWVETMFPGWGWPAAPWAGWAVTVGWAAHVAGDCLTPQGCAVLWPLTRRRYGSPVTVTTGGAGEAVVGFLLAVAGAFLGARLLAGHVDIVAMFGYYSGA